MTTFRDICDLWRADSSDRRFTLERVRCVILSVQGSEFTRRLLVFLKQSNRLASLGLATVILSAL